MDMREISAGVLAADAQLLKEGREELSGKSVGLAISEALAETAMKGDIKAAQLLMELAGEDIKSRELSYKHSGQQAGAPILIDARPE